MPLGFAKAILGQTAVAASLDLGYINRQAQSMETTKRLKKLLD